MDQLPLLPKTKTAWFATLILVPFLFLYYYGFLYQDLLEKFEDQSLSIPYTYKGNDGITKNLEVYLILPKNLGANIVDYGTISVFNLEKEAVDLKLKPVWNVEGVKDEDINKNLHIKNIEGEIQREDALLQVQPNSFEYFRFPVIFFDDFNKVNDNLIILVSVLSPDGKVVDEEELTAETNSFPNYNWFLSSLDLFLGKLLLPPIANGLLPAITIMFCWFFEEKKEEDNKIVWAEVLKIIINSGKYLFVFITGFYFFILNVNSSLLVLLIWMFIITFIYIQKYKEYRTVTEILLSKRKK